MTYPHPVSVAAIVLGGLIAGLPTTGHAADLLRPALAEVAVAELIDTGWYLRGDFTESFHGRPSDAAPSDSNDPGRPPLIGLRLSHEGGYGGGVGYRINSWLRVDATVDQRAPAGFSTYSSRSNFETGYNVEAGKLDVLTGLINVYADLGTWWGFTPYLGGGLGFAEKSFHANYTQTTCIQEACDGLAGTGPRTAASRPKHDLASFAWAVGGGVSYRIWEGLSLDASYRYVDLGQAKSGIDAYGGSTRLKDLSTQEIRIGLRYQFAGGFLPTFGVSNPYGN